MSARPAALLPFPDTASVGAGGVEVGGVALADLAAEHGTPLYVYDAASIRTRANAVATAIRDAPGGGRAAYALKANATLALLRLIRTCGLGADCASAGEIAAALRAGMRGDDLVVHGNAKSDADLDAAIAADAALVVVDGRDDAERLAARCRAAGRAQDVLVRIAPGIEVDTHRHIATGHHGSKFGVGPEDGAALLRDLPPGLRARGLHVHLGSQVLAPEPLIEAARWLPAFARSAGIDVEVLDVGGGLGIRYLPEQAMPDPGAHTRAVASAVAAACADAGVPMPELIVEPGRSVVGQSGVTLYRVLGVKAAGDGTTWVAVDGGMGDNMRVGLYGARYAPLLCGRPLDDATGTFGIAGRHCESTDVIAEGVPLPAPRVGDVIAVPATGAYHQSMAHAYNLFGRPAAVLVEGGAVTAVTRRESVEDLLTRDT